MEKTRRKKTTPINLMVESEVKEKLLQKSKELNLSLTNFFEKIANEPIVFLDNNTKKLLQVFKFSF